MGRSAPYKRYVKLGEAPPALPIPTTAPLTELNRQVPIDTLGPKRRGAVLTAMEIRSRIHGLMNKFEYDPIEELMHMATDKDDEGKFLYPAEFRKSIHVELAQFVAPKLKSTDIHVDQSMDITIQVVKFGGQHAAARESVPILVKEVREA